MDERGRRDRLKPFRRARRFALVGALALSACANVPTDERLLMQQADGSIMAVAQPCGPERAQRPQTIKVGLQPFGSPTLRVVSWNLHKTADDGWDVDLARFATDHDLVLLQEAVMSEPVRKVLERAGLDWLMAGAFAWNGQERGVMVAARVGVVDGCTLRAFEPLLPLPKSALVVRFRLGAGTTVAVANLHGINFTLGLDRFREQLEAVGAELARHQGPAILAGDFNTWSEARHQVLADVAAKLGLVSVLIDEPDGRRRTLGRHLDHFYFRGFRLVRASAPVVSSSDHNPILVELELR
jgi:endonuclease/exonuclease/phosphatase (EEP) superfamily protein YafD